MTKRILFALLAILVLLALFPVAAQAHGGEEDGTTASQGPGDDDHDDDDDDQDDGDDERDERDDRDDDDDDDRDDRNDGDDDRDDDRRRRESADDDPPINDARTPAPRPTGSSGAADGGTGGTSSTPVQVTVDIVDRRFSPATVSVPVGSTVTWRNSDDRPHTATGGTFDSGILDAGGTFRMTFESPGTFAYICELHPEMRGTVIVGGQGGDSPATTAGTSHSAPGPASSNRTAASAGSTTAAAGDGAGNDARAGGRSAPAATHDVSIVDFAFDAAALEVHAGDRIRWTNDGAAPHTATAEGTFDSGILESGQTFTTQLDDPGTIEYRCLLHPDMVATITVVAASSGTSPNGTGRARGTEDGAADATVSRADTGSNTADAAAGPADVATPSSGTQAATSGRTAPGLLVTGFVLLAAALITGLNRFLRMAADESH